MCCFSGPVQRVSDTKIFARASAGAQQLLAYAMSVQMKTELAMILPIPTPAGSAENAVRFISLKEYPEFFADCHRGWPIPPAARAGGFGAPPPAMAIDRKLEVVQVGNFEASFVPTVADFARLDERFRLPDGSWQELGDYQGWGFAVFKLKPGSMSVHPMAFEFPRRRPDRLFFPTVHIHDGKVHQTAGFDHVLYCQLPARTDAAGWSASPRKTASFMNIDKSAGLVDASQTMHRRFLRGRLKNQDTWLG